MYGATAGAPMGLPSPSASLPHLIPFSSTSLSLTHGSSFFPFRWLSLVLPLLVRATSLLRIAQTATQLISRGSRR